MSWGCQTLLLQRAALSPLLAKTRIPLTFRVPLRAHPLHLCITSFPSPSPSSPTLFHPQTSRPPGSPTHGAAPGRQAAQEGRRKNPAVLPHGARNLSLPHKGSRSPRSIPASPNFAAWPSLAFHLPSMSWFLSAVGLLVFGGELGCVLKWGEGSQPMLLWGL